MKRYKVISATALAAMLLVTGSSKSVFAAEKETTTQQV
ncbi:methyltransferase, partial [Bacillus thuringiensis]